MPRRDGSLTQYYQLYTSVCFKVFDKHVLGSSDYTPKYETLENGSKKLTNPFPTIVNASIVSMRFTMVLHNYSALDDRKGLVDAFLAREPWRGRPMHHTNTPKYYPDAALTYFLTDFMRDHIDLAILDHYPTDSFEEMSRKVHSMTYFP